MEWLIDGSFKYESWEEYADHSLTHDDLEVEVPYEVRSNGSAFEVINRDTGKVKAKHTSKEEADRQVKLLHAIEHGWKPTGKVA